MASKRTQPTKSIAEKFGDAVKRHRQKINITQDELAHRAEIDRSYMSQIERGLKNVTLPVVHKLAAALNIKPSKLVSEIEED